MKKVTCKICDITENTGFDYPHDLDNRYHEGFTIGKGKQMYWMMIWHGSGNTTVFTADVPLRRRWISGGTLITIHWKEGK